MSRPHFMLTSCFYLSSTLGRTSYSTSINYCEATEFLEGVLKNETSGTHRLVPGDTVVNLTDTCLGKNSDTSDCWQTISDGNCALKNAYQGSRSMSINNVSCSTSSSLNWVKYKSFSGMCITGNTYGPHCLTVENKWEFCYPPCIDDCIGYDHCWHSYKFECSLSNNIYTGSRNTAISGTPCQFWNETTTWYNQQHNFCRNPTLERSGPYCMIMYEGVLYKRRCFADCEVTISPKKCFDSDKKCWVVNHDLCQRVSYEGARRFSADGKACIFNYEDNINRCAMIRGEPPSCSTFETDLGYNRRLSTDRITESCFAECDTEELSCLDPKTNCWKWNLVNCRYNETKTYSRSGKKCVSAYHVLLDNVQRGTESYENIMFEPICQRQFTYWKGDSRRRLNMAWCFTNDAHQPYESCYDPCPVEYDVKTIGEIISDSLQIDAIYEGHKPIVDDDGTPDVSVNLVEDAVSDITEICASITYHQYASNYITIYEERLDKSIVELLADIGGVVGLYFGFSALTIIHILYYCVKKLLDKRHKEKVEATRQAIIANAQSRLFLTTFKQAGVPSKPEDTPVEDKVIMEMSEIQESTIESVLKEIEELKIKQAKEISQLEGSIRRINNNDL